MFSSRYMPCPNCGASLERHDHAHECERERWLAFQLFQLRNEIDKLEAELAEYFASPSGRFELYYAERDRRRQRSAE
jgi:hypothetical protein